MVQVPAAAHVVAWVVLGGGIGLVLVNQQKEARRLDALEEAGIAAPAPTPGADAAAKAKEQAAIDAKLNAAETRQANELGQVRNEVQKLWAELVKSPDGAAASPGASPAAQ